MPHIHIYSCMLHIYIYYSLEEYRSLLQKSPIKETIFRKKTYSFEYMWMCGIHDTHTSTYIHVCHIYSCMPHIYMYYSLEEYRSLLQKSPIKETIFSHIHVFTHPRVSIRCAYMYIYEYIFFVAPANVRMYVCTHPRVSIRCVGIL